MQAVLMCGGKGSRLHPFTATFPKPLMPLGDKPILELLLAQLVRAGVTDVVLAVNHLHHLIRAFFGDGERFGVRILYSLEEAPLGTAGPLSLIKAQLDDQFLVMNGDLLTSFDLAKFYANHSVTGAAASLAVYRQKHKIDYGLVKMTDRAMLLGYDEKPTMEYAVSMGLYVMTKAAILPKLREGEYLDMPDLMRALVADGKDVHCASQDCMWLDIGRPEDYATAQELYQKDAHKLLGT